MTAPPELRPYQLEIIERVGVHEFSREFSMVSPAGATLKARHSCSNDPIYALLAALGG